MKKNKIRLFVQILELEQDKLYIEGYFNTSLLQEGCFYAKDQNGKTYDGQLFHLPNRDEVVEGVNVGDGTGFRMSLPLKGGRTYRFFFKGNEQKEKGIATFFGRSGKLTRKTEANYYAKGKYMVQYHDNSIKVKKNSNKTHLKAEWAFIKDLLKNKAYELAAIRVVANIMRKLKKEEIWIIYDRSYLAGDNAEALFRYIQKEKPSGIKSYFMLDRDSRDFQRMKSIGPVLKKDSFYFKCKFLCADKIISSHADVWVTNPFMDQVDLMKNMYDFSYVFLQHGVAQNDMSVWLHKHNKDIRLLVTSAKPEYDSFFTYPYGYDEDVVKLTGLPRYDYLENEAEKRIVFLPTWRKHLAGPVIKGSSQHIYTEEFKTSDYCKFYNGLINDPQLLATMKEYGYTGEFYVHPSFDAQQPDFQGNDLIQVIGETAKYNQVFRRNALLITDYSSVAFDFAYMKKPIVYSQYDKDTFFAGHLFEEGYFDFSVYGFGPVCRDHQQAVDAIIASIKQDCVMEEKYTKRVDDFFMYTDKNNCKRVLDAILNMK